LKIDVTRNDEIYPAIVSVTRYIPRMEKNFVSVVIYGDDVRPYEKRKNNTVAMPVWIIQNRITSILNGTERSNTGCGDLALDTFLILSGIVYRSTGSVVEFVGWSRC